MTNCSNLFFPPHRKLHCKMIIYDPSSPGFISEIQMHSEGLKMLSESQSALGADLSHEWCHDVRWFHSRGLLVRDQPLKTRRSIKIHFEDWNQSSHEMSDSYKSFMNEKIYRGAMHRWKDLKVVGSSPEQNCSSATPEDHRTGAAPTKLMTCGSYSEEKSTWTSAVSFHFFTFSAREPCTTQEEGKSFRFTAAPHLLQVLFWVSSKQSRHEDSSHGETSSLCFWGPRHKNTGGRSNQVDCVCVSLHGLNVHQSWK